MLVGFDFIYLKKDDAAFFVGWVETFFIYFYLYLYIFELSFFFKNLIVLIKTDCVKLLFLFNYVKFNDLLNKNDFCECISELK